MRQLFSGFLVIAAIIVGGSLIDDRVVVVRGHATGSSLVIEVADTGAGIDADVLPHIFERFAKGSGSAGSGLGLAIARNLATAHGGTLVAAATGSAGTTFRLELPLD